MCYDTRLQLQRIFVSIRDIIAIEFISYDNFRLRPYAFTIISIVFSTVRSEYLDTRFAEFAKDGKMHMEVAYSGNPEEAEEWAALVKETFPQFDFHMDPLSLSVACHIGHGALAIATSAYLPELD